MSTAIESSPLNVAQCFDELRSIRERMRDIEAALIHASAIVPRDLEKEHLRRVQTIKELVAARFSISVEQLSVRKRTENIMWPRHIAMTLSREFTELGLKSIGLVFGGLDHGTVINAIMRVSDRCECEPKRKALVNELRASLSAAFNNNPIPTTPPQL